jgi:hypothetical protein
MAHLPKTLRLSRQVHARDMLHATEMRQLEQPQGTWKMPGPHPREVASVGGNVHTDLRVQTDNRTTAEVISDMMAQVR